WRGPHRAPLRPHRRADSRLSRGRRLVRLRRWLPGVRGPCHRGRPARQGDCGRAPRVPRRAVSEPSLGGRSLADRLAAIRAERPAAPSRAPDRADGLARWLGAELRIAEVGRVVLVERTVALPAATSSALAALPRACYFDTETTGLSTGAGTVIFLAALGWLDG